MSGLAERTDALSRVGRVKDPDGVWRVEWQFLEEDL